MNLFQERAPPPTTAGNGPPRCFATPRCSPHVAKPTVGVRWPTRQLASVRAVILIPTP